MSLHIITAKQNEALQKMQRRIKASCREPYTVSVTYTPTYKNTAPGEITLLASNSAVFSRLVRMLKRIVPEAKLKVEHGYGWHYLDRTPYHYADVDFLLNLKDSRSV